MELSVLRGLAVFRWAAWIWMATVLALARAALVRPAVAVALVVAALLVTVWATSQLRATHPRPGRPAIVGSEVAVALGLQLADGFVYRAPHVFEAEQPLGVAWPLAAILSVGVSFGPVPGVLAAVLMGAARTFSSMANVAPDPTAEGLYLSVLTPQQGMSLLTTTVLYALAGGVGGYLVRQLRDVEVRASTAERSLAEAQAREAMARRLHDGVLQTLALVERRSDDPQLARLARDTERQLRDDLFGSPTSRVIGKGALGDGLRAASRRCERTFDLRVEVLVPDDLPALSDARVEALTGAVSEALTNVGKHAEADRVVVYVEPLDDAVEVSVRDDGRGFDPGEVPEGIGLGRSIRGRIHEVGGAVAVDAAAGQGTEVRMTVPSDAAAPDDEAAPARPRRPSR